MSKVTEMTADMRKAAKKEAAKKNGQKKTAYSWTQPVCDDCWSGLKLKTGRAATGMNAHHCCFCRGFISAGTIHFIRINPGTVPHPSVQKT